MLMTPKQYIPQSIIGRNLEYYGGITSRQNQQGGGCFMGKNHTICLFLDAAQCGKYNVTGTAPVYI